MPLEKNEKMRHLLQGRVCTVRASLRCRLEKLEKGSRREASKRATIRYGWVKRLPMDFAGERHTVIVKREPAGSPWCHFEERPGPAPPGSEHDGLTICLTE
jgi:hypothetical protein